MAQAQNVEKSLEGKWKISIEEEVTLVITLKEAGALQFGIMATPEDLDGPIVVSMGGTWGFTPNPEGPGLGVLSLEPSAEDFDFEYLGNNSEIKAFFAMLTPDQLKEMGGALTEELDAKNVIVLEVTDETLTVKGVSDEEDEEEQEPRVFERVK